jgi:hypothetical protein
MPTPHRPEADMLHMQHANVVAVLVRQNEAIRLKAQRDAIAKARREAASARTAEPGAVPAAPLRAPTVHRPSPA